MPRRFRILVTLRPRVPALAALLAFATGLAAAAPPAEAPGALPASIAEALARAGVPASGFALWVQPVDAAAPLREWNPDAGMNPASVFKLATTIAALDLIGPAWHWKTPVYFTGPVRHGVLHGSVVIRGSGDPSLVLERVWLLLRQVRDAGVREIDGDIVLDHDAFAPTARSPADFDGAPAEPYNVQPDALLLNFKSVTLGFVPDPQARVARMVAEPPLAGVAADATVRLAPGPCDDWRGALKLVTDDPKRWHAAGRYPESCGARSWPLAYADPASYGTRMVDALWRASGGRLSGRVRDGSTPAGLAPAFEFASPPLAEIVRDINKYSNNVMAEQVFLSLGLQPDPLTATPAAAGDGAPPLSAGIVGVTQDQARAVLSHWLQTRLGSTGTVIANGSGLARETRASARTLAALLQWSWRSPAMPELMASLPLAGVDGTLRRSGAPAGRAHLKTGSMRDVAAIAGYVLADSGRRYVLVAIVNDPAAPAAHAALDAAVDWAMSDVPALAGAR